MCYYFFMTENFLLDGLNDAQKKVVLHTDGPLLVLAGAGSGKTKSITHRVAHLVSSGVAPENILAITFTNKAAGEMKERTLSLLKQIVDNPTGQKNKTPFISTFHSLGVYMLKNSGKAVGVTRGFSILDKEESLGLIKEAIKELNIDPKQFQPSKMQSIISKNKGELMSVDTYETDFAGDFFPAMLAKIWRKYEEYLIAHKALDFDDLVSKTVFLLKQDAIVRDYYQNLWKYIIIDEYQDTNKSQYEFSKILAAKSKNICAVGDMDQCIYAFRGADFRNIINFENDYPNLVSVSLEENYRSTQNILEAAAKIIEKNKVRKPKGLFTKNIKGAEISLFEAMGEQEEAEFVAHKIKELIREGVEPSEIAVLFRANFQSRVLEEACLKHDVPYQMLGTQFYDRKEIKDIFSYIKAALNREDAMSIKRIINVPPRGLGKVSVLNKFAGKKLPVATEAKFAEFNSLLDKIKESSEKERPSSFIKFVLRESGMQKFLESGDPADAERLENVKELASIAARYDGLPLSEGVEKMVEDFALMAVQDSLDKKENSARLMTAHAAKGLEFDYVFITGLEDGLFPHSGMGNSLDEDEEERRLFYVALTRARKKLFLTFSVMRMIFGSRQANMPSRFLSDIPEYLFKMEEFNREVEDVIRYD